MKVISFLNPKGGSGKTTAVINIATALSRIGYNIAVVDTDPQMSLTNWSKAGKAAFDVFTAASEKDVYGIRKDLADYELSLSPPALWISPQQEASLLFWKHRLTAAKLKPAF